jgi:hypothetical protein
VANIKRTKFYTENENIVQHEPRLNFMSYGKVRSCCSISDIRRIPLVKRGSLCIYLSPERYNEQTGKTPSMGRFLEIVKLDEGNGARIYVNGSVRLVIIS